MCVFAHTRSNHRVIKVSRVLQAKLVCQVRSLEIVLLFSPLLMQYLFPGINGIKGQTGLQGEKGFAGACGTTAHKVHALIPNGNAPQDLAVWLETTAATVSTASREPLVLAETMETRARFARACVRKLNA